MELNEQTRMLSKVRRNAIEQKTLAERQEGYFVGRVPLFLSPSPNSALLQTHRHKRLHATTRSRHIVHAKGKGRGYAQLALGYCLATSAGCTRQPPLMEEVS